MSRFTDGDIDSIFESLNGHLIEFNDTSYFESYFEFIDFFKSIETIDYHSLVISSYFTYGWMPTILKKFNSTHNSDVVITVLNKVKNHTKIVNDEYRELVSCINNSIVGVSKILHFINPTDYPIYDSRIKRYFKQHNLLESVWKNTYHNKNINIQQYQLYRDICLQVISDKRFDDIYHKSLEQLGFDRTITKMRILENLFFYYGKSTN